MIISDKYRAGLNGEFMTLTYSIMKIGVINDNMPNYSVMHCMDMQHIPGPKWLATSTFL